MVYCIYLFVIFSQAMRGPNLNDTSAAESPKLVVCFTSGDKNIHYLFIFRLSDTI